MKLDLDQDPNLPRRFADVERPHLLAKSDSLGLLTGGYRSDDKSSESRTPQSEKYDQKSGKSYDLKSHKSESDFAKSRDVTGLLNKKSEAMLDVVYSSETTVSERKDAPMEEKSELIRKSLTSSDDVHQRDGEPVSTHLSLSSDYIILKNMERGKSRSNCMFPQKDGKIASRWSGSQICLQFPRDFTRNSSYEWVSNLSLNFSWSQKNDRTRLFFHRVGCH